MDDLNYGLILGFLGEQRDRFVTYGEKREFEQKFEIASKVKGLKGLELVYPYDLKSISQVKELLNKYNLKISAVNVNIKTDKIFRFGSITNQDPGIRQEAVQYLKAGIDVAADMGCGLVTCCPLGDGHDYPFELDYIKAWDWMVECFGEAATYRDDVRVSIEYKAMESRTHVILPNAGVALSVCQQIGRSNVGVTMDMGHALYAGESPAQSAAILGRSGKLFLVHVNDNYRNWDWDMIVASVNPWDVVELFLYLQEVGYNGWLTADVSPNRLDPIETFSATYENMLWAQKMIEKVGQDKLWEMIRGGQPTQALHALLNSDGR